MWEVFESGDDLIFAGRGSQLQLLVARDDASEK